MKKFQKEHLQNILVISKNGNMLAIKKICGGYKEKQISDLQNKICDLKKNITQLEKENHSLKNYKSNAELALHNRKQFLIQYSEQLKMATEDICKLKDLYKDRGALINSKNEKIEKLKLENEKLMIENNKIMDEIFNYFESIKATYPKFYQNAVDLFYIQSDTRKITKKLFEVVSEKAKNIKAFRLLCELLAKREGK